MSDKRESKRARLVYQSQHGEKERGAFCGMYSINNALQIRDFLTRDTMVEHLRAFDHTGQDHGSEKFGAYSIACLQRALQKFGYHLLYLNDFPTFKRARRGDWYSKIERSKFEHMIIIGVPPKQKKGISHCIARARPQCESDTLEVRTKRHFSLIDPDFGTAVECTANTLEQWLPKLLWIYAIVPTSELPVN